MFSKLVGGSRSQKVGIHNIPLFLKLASGFRGTCSCNVGQQSGNLGQHEARASARASSNLIAVGQRRATSGIASAGVLPLRSHVLFCVSMDQLPGQPRATIVGQTVVWQTMVGQPRAASGDLGYPREGNERHKIPKQLVITSFLYAQGACSKPKSRH